MSRSVYIHAGAHRTGTSSFQQCLFRNRAVLAEHGLDAAYPGRDGAPKGKLNLRLPRPWHGGNWPENTVERLRGHLARMNPNKDRGLVFSEENIPGPMRHFFEGRFFPGARQRLRALAQALETPPTHVLYVVRSYDALFLSAYRKRAEDNPVLDFDGLVPTLADMDRGWPGLISDIRDELRPERLTVLEYGDRGSSRDLLARLDGWLLDAEGRWYAPPRGPRVPVRSIHAAGMLAALLDRPGVPLDATTLAEAGWPGEGLSGKTATNRVSVTLSRLRKGGFALLVRARRKGWMIDPDAVVTGCQDGASHGDVAVGTG